MRVDRRTLLLLALGSGCSRPDPLRRAAGYLWKRQQADGGWHSETYGLLRSGQSLTGFVLNALLDAGEDPRSARVRRALDFLERHADGEGGVGRLDPVSLDYPNYATALAARALVRCGRSAGAMLGYLRRQQLTESLGWKPGDAAYGAWGVGGERRYAPYPGHVDLSMTRHVLEALAVSGAGPEDPAMRRARAFVERCQNRDGGFYFSTVVLDANKAGESGAGFRSYGTATADGLLSLLALGEAKTAPRVEAAWGWLREHHVTSGAPGFTGEAHQRWTAGLRFYYAAASAEAFLAMSAGAGVAGPLLRTQRGDGSWANPEPLVKEDDPLIATGFAVRALRAERSIAAVAKDLRPA
jgi:prenyltransferase beta subunit